MKALKRLFLGILILVVVAFCVLLVLVAINAIPLDYMQTFINVIYTVPVNAWLLALIAAVLFVMCIVAVFGRTGDKKQEAEKRASAASALIRASDIGATYIAVSALDTMVQKCVRSNARIKDCVSRVVADSNCVAINLRLALMPDTNVLELTEAVQNDVKKYIESLTGIVVREIHILIDNMSNSASKVRVD